MCVTRTNERPIHLKSTLRIFILRYADYTEISVCLSPFHSLSSTYCSAESLSLTHTNAESFFILFFYYLAHTHPLRIYGGNRVVGGRWLEGEEGINVHKLALKLPFVEGNRFQRLWSGAKMEKRGGWGMSASQSLSRLPVCVLHCGVYFIIYGWLPPPTTSLLKSNRVRVWLFRV